MFATASIRHVALAIYYLRARVQLAGAPHCGSTYRTPLDGNSHRADSSASRRAAVIRSRFDHVSDRRLHAWPLVGCRASVSPPFLFTPLIIVPPHAASIRVSVTGPPLASPSPSWPWRSSLFSMCSSRTRSFASASRCSAWRAASTRGARRSSRPPARRPCRRRWHGHRRPRCTRTPALSTAPPAACRSRRPSCRPSAATSRPSSAAAVRPRMATSSTSQSRHDRRWP